MTTLVLGANTVIDGTVITIKTKTSMSLGRTVGMIWLALDEHRRAKVSPAYLHEPKDWATVTDDVWTLNLAKAFGEHGVHKLQLVVYAYYDPNLAVPATELSELILTINETIEYQVMVNERHIKASVVLEIYERQGQYKCRALAEHSAQSLKVFGEHLQISLNEKYPNQTDNTLPSVQAGDTWTGTAFAIDKHHLLTCHHVIDGASVIGIHQQGRSDQQAKVVMSDAGSDSAILRVDEPLSTVVSLGIGQLELLGEQIVAMGFPLSGLNSQLQVTTGNVAALVGLHDDIRFLQFTAPIQPGSSGSPLLLPTGQVIGMVTSSLSNAQNMNYAVKYQLLSALLTSVGIANDSHNHPALNTPQLIKQHKDALWLVGCQA